MGGYQQSALPGAAGGCGMWEHLLHAFFHMGVQIQVAQNNVQAPVQFVTNVLK